MFEKYLIGARRACDGVGQANGKSLLLSPAPTIETEGLFLDVFHQDRAGAWPSQTPWQ